MKDNNINNIKKEDSGLKLNIKTIIGVCIILFAIMVAAGILTQVVPRGVYDTDAEGMIINGTYHSVDYRMPIWKILASPLLIFGSEKSLAGVAIVLFIVLLGGTFLILDEVNVLKYLMAVIIKKFSGKKYMLMSVMMLALMALSSVAGVLEETITLVPISVAIALTLGWDSLVGIMMSFGAVVFGFAAATFNPFNVVTVQKLAGIPVFSGLWMRLIMFASSYLLILAFTMVYAKKIEKKPEKSLCFDTDKEMREKYKIDDAQALLENSKLKKSSLLFFTFVMCALICVAVDFIFDMSGYVSMGGMAVMFTLGGLAAGHSAGLNGKELASGFFRGVKTIAPALPLILFVLSITYILQEGMIVDTILYKLYSLIYGVTPYLAIIIIFVFVALLEFFIGSGTAKAFLIMPIVAPLARLVGISGNTLVLSYCMADGFTNMLYPTSGLIIIAIGLVNVSYGKWIKFSGKLFALQVLLSIALMHLSIFAGY
ncbi:MAG: AbgT family transporter [Clostridiales bacterium]|nr:AbgT family transporter [Clostridiales bacterium]